MMPQRFAERAPPPTGRAGGAEKWQEWQLSGCFSSIRTPVDTGFEAEISSVFRSEPAIVPASEPSVASGKRCIGHPSTRTALGAVFLLFFSISIVRHVAARR